MHTRQRQLEQTRKAILEALGAVIAEEGLLDLSIQKVADRAGVTHRTVYNHFPTRQALNDAFAVHVEEQLARMGTSPPDEARAEQSTLPKLAVEFAALARDEPAVALHAYAMLMIGSRAPSKVMRDRSLRFERLVEREAGPLPPGVARLATAATRMFISSIGWHVLTELHGLTSEETGRLSEWAVRVLLEAIARGDVPTIPPKEPRHDDRPAARPPALLRDRSRTLRKQGGRARRAARPRS